MVKADKIIIEFKKTISINLSRNLNVNVLQLARKENYPMNRTFFDVTQIQFELRDNSEILEYVLSNEYIAIRQYTKQDQYGYHQHDVPNNFFPFNNIKSMQIWDEREE